MKRSDAFPSRYMGKDDVAKPIVLHISRVDIEDIGTDSEIESKPVMHWQESDAKPLILNSTNWGAIEAAYGDESDNWANKPVELFNDPSVQFMGKRVGGVRVRIPLVSEPGSEAPF